MNFKVSSSRLATVRSASSTSNSATSGFGLTCANCQALQISEQNLFVRLHRARRALAC